MASLWGRVVKYIKGTKEIGGVFTAIKNDRCVCFVCFFLVFSLMMF